MNNQQNIKKMGNKKEKTIQIANNNQVEDYILSDRKIIQDYSGKVLEMKYMLKTQKELKNFIDRKDKIKKDIESIRKDLKFSKILCRFFFGDYQPNIDEQKELVEFQKPIFDEVTIHMIDDEFEDFKKIYGYAINKLDKPLSPLFDIILDPALTSQVIEYLKDTPPNSIRWKYRKISTYIDRYKVVRELMKKLGVPYYLVSCLKRCSVNDEFRDIDASTIAKASFGFYGCCLDYKPMALDEHGKKRPFPPPETMDVFSLGKYEWVLEENKNYKNNRTKNYVNLDRAKINSIEIQKRQKFKKLVEHLIEIENV